MEFYEFLAAYSMHREISELGYHIYYTTQLRDLSRKLCVQTLLNDKVSIGEYYRQAADIIGLSNLIKYERLWEKARSFEYYLSRNGDINHILTCVEHQIISDHPNCRPETRNIVFAEELNREVVEYDVMDFTLQNRCDRDSWDWRYDYIKRAMFVDDLTDVEYISAVSHINDIVEMEGADGLNFDLYFVIWNIMQYGEVPKMLQSLSKRTLSKIIELCNPHDIYKYYINQLNDIPVDNIPGWLMVIVDDNYTLKNDYTGFFHYYNPSSETYNRAISREIRLQQSTWLRVNYGFTVSDDAADTLRRLYDAVGHRAYVSMFIYYEYATEYLGYGQIYVDAIHKLCQNDTFRTHIDAVFMEELSFHERISSYFDREYCYDYDCAIFCKDTRPMLDVLYTPDNTRLIYDCLHEMDMDNAIPVLLPQCCWMMYEQA